MFAVEVSNRFAALSPRKTRQTGSSSRKISTQLLPPILVLPSPPKSLGFHRVAWT